MKMIKEEIYGCLYRFRSFIAIVLLQVGFAGMDILSKAALNQGMSNYVLVVYRHTVATLVMAPFAYVLDRKMRSKMSCAIFIKIMVLGLLEPVIDQNLYFLGMKYTTATFATAMYNVCPAITFVIAWICRMEIVKFRSVRTQAKIIGTLSTVAGAMIMTMIKGPALELFWTANSAQDQHTTGNLSLQSSIKGAIFIIVGCFSNACFVVLQAITLKEYPAELSLTAWICLLGTIEGTAVALVMERGNAAAWAISWDTKLLTVFYTGIICSGLAYYVQGVVMKDRGPVFVSAFNPLCMVIVAIMSSFIFAEIMYLGRVLGAVVVVLGLYLVVWGKSKDYHTQDKLTDVETRPPKQTIEVVSNGKENLNHDVITIDETIR